MAALAARKRTRLRAARAACWRDPLEIYFVNIFWLAGFRPPPEPIPLRIYFTKYYLAGMGSGRSGQNPFPEDYILENIFRDGQLRLGPELARPEMFSQKIFRLAGSAAEKIF